MWSSAQRDESARKRWRWNCNPGLSYVKGKSGLSQLSSPSAPRNYAKHRKGSEEERERGRERARKRGSEEERQPFLSKSQSTSGKQQAPQGSALVWLDPAWGFNTVETFDLSAFAFLQNKGRNNVWFCFVLHILTSEPNYFRWIINHKQRVNWHTQKDYILSPPAE